MRVRRIQELDGLPADSQPLWRQHGGKDVASHDHISLDTDRAVDWASGVAVCHVCLLPCGVD